MANHSRQPVYDLATDCHADIPPPRPPKRAFMCDNPAYSRGDEEADDRDDGPPLPPKKSGPGVLKDNPAYRAASTITTALSTRSTYELEDNTSGESKRPDLAR